MDTQIESVNKPKKFKGKTKRDLTGKTVKVFKYPIEMGENQRLKFESWVRTGRSFYNLLIEQREVNFNHGHKRYSNLDAATPSGGSLKPRGKYYTAFNQQKETTLLREEFPHFSNVPSEVLSSITEQIAQAFQAFYANIQSKKTKGPVQRVKFSNRFEDFSLQSKSCKGFEVDLLSGGNNARIFGFPKCKEGIKVNYYRPVEGEARYQIIKKEGEKWFLCVVCEVPIIKCFSDQRPSVGIDMGVKKTIALSNNTEKNLPYAHMENLVKRKKVLQRRLRNKKRHSKNSKKAHLAIAKIDGRIANIRKYHLKMFASEIARDHKAIAVENLSVKNMTKSAKGTVENPGTNVAAKSGLNRAVLNSSPFFFKSFLIQKAREHSSEVIQVDPRYTSQTCFKCKSVSKDNRKSQASFVCVECGHSDNSDYNAAKNILFKSIK